MAYSFLPVPHLSQSEQVLWFGILWDLWENGSIEINFIMAQVVTTILLDNHPRGFRMIEMANWPGKAFVVPRGKLKELKNREDVKQPGLYMLFGEGEDKTTAYIGQSENVVDRLFSHDLNREEDEWNVAVIFVGQLDSTFIKYLESVSLYLAKKADRYTIFNKGGANKNTLSEAQKIIANEYFERIKIIMGLLGYSVFDVVSESIADENVYLLKADGAEAKAQFLDDGSLNVLKGSLARIRETRAFFGWSKVARKKFVEDGTLINNEDNISFRFTKDVVFNSPTAAAATVTGRPVNGWTAWKDEHGKTLDENVRK